ncbi:MAG: TonB-dependent siderophore receptor [Acidobacteria bacterium]|nr:MAG: TonB-dependent siderophore receptor [Acidobacteriota bacterium]
MRATETQSQLGRFVILTFLALPAWAAQFEGRAVDVAGAPIANASVSAFAGSSTKTTRTDADGHFALALDPGRYVLRVADDAHEIVEEVSVIDGMTPHDFVLQTVVRDTITVRAPDGYVVPNITSATKTATPLRDVPQSVTVVTRRLMQDQVMTSVGDVVRYVPGVMLHQGENNRDQVIMRGNSSSADFFVDGVRDDVQYYRDLYNLERVEALKGPNAMIFGRGGAGGVINRVTKEAGFTPLRELWLQGGAWNDRRVSADLDQPLNDKLALRLNGVYQKSDSFRKGVELERQGIAPSLTFLPSDRTKVTFGYEYFHDGRGADRGISSYAGKPADVPIETYYGNPDDSRVRATVHLASASIDHSIGTLSIRNHTQFGDYDRFYQNYVPGAVSVDKSRVSISAYNNATQRQNLFNQTDLTWNLGRHTLLAGTELGRQATDNFRNTGFFNTTATSISAPYLNPIVTTPVTYRQSATDANNHLIATVAAAYAQDQFAVSPHLQLVAGLRFDRFDLDYHNNRNGDDLSRADNLVSPRLGIVVKPTEALSLYSNYSISYLPGSGDQFSSLTTITEQLKPEQFTNYELGAKWDASSSFSLTTAVYRLDRTNTRSTDPNDPTRIVQTGGQRTNGFEFGVNGRVTNRWSIAGGYSWQDAFVASATATARAGATVAQVPHHTFSLWNNYDLTSRLSTALGIVARTNMFAAIDNTVTLPGYTELDAAAFYRVTDTVRLQMNVENLLDTTYYKNADSNTNISPGAPRGVRVAVLTRF